VEGVEGETMIHLDGSVVDVEGKVGDDDLDSFGGRVVERSSVPRLDRARSLSLTRLNGLGNGDGALGVALASPSSVGSDGDSSSRNASSTRTRSSTRSSGSSSTTSSSSSSTTTRLARNHLHVSTEMTFGDGKRDRKDASGGEKDEMERGRTTWRGWGRTSSRDISTSILA
jgi:hypothetical protein